MKRNIFRPGAQLFLCFETEDNNEKSITKNEDVRSSIDEHMNGKIISLYDYRQKKINEIYERAKQMTAHLK